MNRNIQANAEKELQNRLSSAPLRHSQLAMSAAKRMSRARKKERVGRVVCHHLLKMLASDTPVAVNQGDFELAPQFAPQLGPLSASLDANGDSAKDHLSLVPSQVLAQQAEQYSLSI